MLTCEGNELRVLLGNVYEGRDVACGSLRFFWCCVFCAFSGSLAGFPRGQTPELSVRGRSRILPPSVGVGLCVCVCVCVCVCLCVSVSVWSSRASPRAERHHKVTRESAPSGTRDSWGGLTSRIAAPEKVSGLFLAFFELTNAVFSVRCGFACAARPCGR